MALEFHTLRVSNITRETQDSVSVSFDIPANLQDKFQYKPGQYLTLKPRINGSEPRRSYSLCSSPLEEGAPAVTVKLVENGLVSTYVNRELKVGDTLEVMPPLGNFCVDIQPYNARHYVLIGAGSGITPLMSILKSVLYGETNSRVTLLYGNRNQDSVIFRRELDALAARFPERFTLVHILSQAENSWQGQCGRLNEAKVLELLKATVQAENIKSCFYYLCGPSGMIAAAQQALEDAGVDKARISREFFTTPLPGGAATDVGSDGGEAGSDFTEATVTVVLYGMETTLKVKPEETILDVAIREDVDPPFACQIGACCTCRARLISGKVEMDEREALTDEEIADGYILTCQAHPLSPAVVVDYDQ